MTDQRDIRDDERTRCRREEARRIGLKEGSDWAACHAPKVGMMIDCDRQVMAWPCDVVLSDDTEVRGYYVQIEQDGICQHDDWIEGGRATIEEIAAEAMESYLADCRAAGAECLDGLYQDAIRDAIVLERDIARIARDTRQAQEPSQHVIKLRNVLQELKDTIERMEAAL